jgi:hypothetical protein
MRALLVLGILLLVILALLSGAARGLGSQREPNPAPFPLPDSAGCWEGLCFFAIPQEELEAALIAHPALTVTRSTAAPDTDPAFLRQSFQLVYDTPGRRTAQLRLGATFYWVTLSGGWEGTHALDRLGTVIEALGAPDRVALYNQHSDPAVALEYLDRQLTVWVQPSGGGPRWAHLRPTDRVVALRLANPDTPYPGPVTYAPSTGDWAGFGRYEFATDEIFITPLVE